MSDTGRTAPGEHGALTRFAARLAEIEPSAAAAITAVPTDRNEHERAAYIGAWQRVEAAGAIPLSPCCSVRLSPPTDAPSPRPG